MRTVRLSRISSVQSQDSRRYTVLMAACRLQDVFYVKVHQLCCLWSIDKITVYEIFDSLVTPNAIDFTLNELQKILTGDNPAPCDLRWFSTFPSPARGMLTSFPERSLAVDIAEFIDSFNNLWQTLLDQIEIDGYPVSGAVLRNILHCGSPLLRYVLHTACCVQIGIVSGPEATVLDEEFERGEGEGIISPGETVRHVLASEQALSINRQLQS